MSQGDDDEGNTLVSPVVHQPPSRIPRPAPPVLVPPDARATLASDQDSDEDDHGMGTFIMGPEQHAAASAAAPAPALPAAPEMSALATMPTEVLERPGLERPMLEPIPEPTVGSQGADPLARTVPFAEPSHRGAIPASMPAPREPAATSRWVDPPVVQSPEENGEGARPDAKLMAVGGGAAVLVGLFIAGVVLVMRGASTPDGDGAASAPQPAATTGPTSTALATGTAVTTVARAQVSAAPSVPVTADPTSKPAPSATAASVVDASPLALTGDAAEAAAKKALLALRTGVAKCMKDVIHVLPGTSPAVPASIAWLKSGPYAPMLNDWSTPFFACTGFRVDEPMPYVIQWQLDRGKGTGLGIAWLDDDRDGKADRAFGFTVSTKGGISLGEIEKVDPALPVAKSR